MTRFIELKSLVPTKYLDPKIWAEHPDFNALVDSVKDRGFLEPLKVKEMKDGTYQIIDGHMRFEAAKLTNHAKIMVLVVEKE